MKWFKRFLMLMGAVFVLLLLLVGFAAVAPSDLDSKEEAKLMGFLAKATAGELVFFREPENPLFGKAPFHELKILQRVDFERPGVDYLREGLSGSFFLSKLGLKVYCFNPRHGILLKDAKGNQLFTKICFSCLNLQIENGPISEMPPSWYYFLRDEFLEAGFPLK